LRPLAKSVQTREGRRRWQPPAFAMFVMRRLAALVLLLIGITLVSFVLTHAVPGNPALANLGQAPPPGEVHAFDRLYHLNESLPQQYLYYMDRLVLHGDLGISQQTHDPVLSDLKKFVPATAELAALSLLIAIPCGICFGLIAALRHNRWIDHVLRVFSLVGTSVPSFWLALVALYLFFFKFGLLPGGGRLDPTTVPPPNVTGFFTIDALLAGQWGTFWKALEHLILPASVLSLMNLGLLTRYTRTTVLEVIGQDYIRSARAKGLPERKIVVGHILRAALPALVTVIGIVFANVLTGAVLIEEIFGWPGIGQYGYHAAITLDLPAIAGVSLFVAAVYITTNFVVDVLYGVLDPRIRLMA
jgi:peptide/nickel transport system permease protein